MNTFSDSFPFENPLLGWLPGETLFSLCSRHHHLWGHGQAARTAQLMFGHSRAGTHHDFPSALDEFTLRTMGVYGKSGQLAREHTLLRYFLPFMEASETAQAIGVMQSGSVAHLKFKLGLLTSRFRANHPLKACTQCMQQDVERHGWAYWHLVHQYPGVWTCPEHGELLNISVVKSTGVERFLWHLPDSNRLVAPFKPGASPQQETLQKFSELVVHLVEEPRGDGWLNPAALQRTLHACFAEKGWMTASGQLRLSTSAKSYRQYLEGFHAISEFDGLPADEAAANAQLGRLLRTLRTGTHPLRWLSLIDWLFKDASDFLRQLDSDRLGAESGKVTSNLCVPKSDLRLVADHDQKQVLLLEMVQGGTSPTRAARQVGVDTATALAWVAQRGVETQRRPKLLKPSLLEAVLQDLKAGAEKADVAETHGISIQTVTKVLRTQVGLHAEWTHVRFSHAQQNARTTWLETLQQCDGLGVKWLRTLQPAVFAWLYRNDRAWLKDHSPKLSVRSQRRSTVNWDERDSELSLSVQQAANKLHADQSTPIKLWQMYQAIPELKAKLSALTRLPLTRKALETALMTHRAYGEADLF